MKTGKSMRLKDDSKKFGEKGLSRPYIIFLEFPGERVSCKAEFCWTLDPE
jgi:hypothetical protein